MADYQLGATDKYVIRTKDGATVPNDPGNRDWQEYQKWLADGAVIYICGSLQGMASGVDQVLNEVLGAEVVLQLIEQGRYRRDVY
jgi:hypothetical protein